MEDMKRIAVIICYFGRLPWYFAYFVHSCRFNPSVDFYVVSDDRTWSRPLPSNVTLRYMSLGEINALATNTLGFATDIRDPYKLNDFKPAYALMFPEIVRRYDFWAYGDIDVIYGNLRRFLTPDLLSGKELISVRHDFISGYFLLLRNSRKMNTLFMLSRDFRKVLGSRKHYCFDETGFQYSEFGEGISYPEHPYEIESMMHVVRRLEESHEIATYFDFHVVEGVPGELKWSYGRLCYKDMFEAILYHLIKLKTVYTPEELPNSIPNSFTISSSSICH